MVGQFTLEHWQDGATHVGRLAEIPFVIARGESVEALRKNIQAAYREAVVANVAKLPEDARREPLQLELPNGDSPSTPKLEAKLAAARTMQASFAEIMDPHVPVLSDEAISRESIYEGTPTL